MQFKNAKLATITLAIILLMFACLRLTSAQENISLPDRVGDICPNMSETDTLKVFAYEIFLLVVIPSVYSDNRFEGYENAVIACNGNGAIGRLVQRYMYLYFGTPDERVHAYHRLQNQIFNLSVLEMFPE